MILLRISADQSGEAGTVEGNDTSAVFCIITYVEKCQEKSSKNRKLLLTIKRALCYSKKCTIMESYAIVAV